ncbi:MAG TPA: TerC/Alx family metal homeostasis membrane protein [Candidatus Acidoferrales bacterium]|nr:TerC/Alx family metal homeostasis membrane protein [Candidatus Acidoferrales bacterium]
MAPAWLWLAFCAALLLLLGIDLLFLARKSRAISIREATLWSAAWIGISLAFTLWLWHFTGTRSALEFLSGYLIEKSLSVDNLFVFVLLFRYFSIDARYQHRVLAWGVIGALVLRGAMIAAGIALVNSFSWMFPLLGAFLTVVAIHLLMRKSEAVHPEDNLLFRWFRKVTPAASGETGASLFVRQSGRLLATRLLLALVAIEVADLVFAVDSIPAVIGVTRDPFLVFSSNACAILGLRALYFVLAGWVERLRHLNMGISFILIFIGAKMILAHWIEIPVTVSLGVIAVLLTAAAAASILDKRAPAGNWPDSRASGNAPGGKS